MRATKRIRDQVTGFRVLQLLPGIGPKTAKKVLTALQQGQYDPAATFSRIHVPKAAAAIWSDFVRLVDAAIIGQLAFLKSAWHGQYSRTLIGL